MAYNVNPTAIEPLVDGIIDLLSVNLVAATHLTQDAHVGDTVLYVDNSRRFQNFDYVVMMDNNSHQDNAAGSLIGVEFHEVATDFQTTSVLTLVEPLQQDFIVSNNARIQKAIRKTILYAKDILYGDRQVITFDSVAICVEPESKRQDWLATRLLGSEARLAIMVYVKSGGTGEEEESAIRICNAYADAINDLLMGNIHLDISDDRVPLVRDAHAGDTVVYVSCGDAANWGPGVPCLDYTVQDNFGANDLLKVVSPPEFSSSSSSSSTVAESSSSSSSSAVLLLSSSSSASSPSSNSSSVSSASSGSSSSSWSSQSGTPNVGSSTSSSSSSGSSSSSSLTSNNQGLGCPVYLSSPLTRDYHVADKAIIRRNKRYTYDSRIDSIEYGMVQKGSVLLKAAKLSWYGKEAKAYSFPQVGLGMQEPTMQT